MAEEKTSQSEEGAVATAEGMPESPAEKASGQAPAKRPIPIALELLTEKAKQEAEEQLGKPIRDMAYTLASQTAIPNSTLSLKFEVAAEEVRKELDRFYENLRKDVVLPGFRKGKAPVKLIRIRMGEEADRDAMIEIAVNVTRQETLRQQLNFVADPQVVDWSMEEGKPLTFEVHAEIPPKIELKEYKGLSVTVETQDVSDAAVDHNIEHLRQDFATWETAPAGHKFAPGDQLVVDLKVTGDKEQELKHLSRENLVLHNTSGLPSELAEKLPGLGTGENATATIKSERQTRKGETIHSADTYQVTVKEIKIRKLPALDDEFAKDLGEEYATLAELRAGVRKDLEHREEERQKGEAVGKIVMALVEKNPIEIPPSMVHSAQIHAIHEDRLQLEQMGLNLGDVVKDPKTYLQGRWMTGELRVKQALLCGEVSKVEKLEVTDEDLEKEIARIAENSGRKPLAVRAKLEAEKKLDALRNEMVDRKITDFLLANNTVEKVASKPAEKKPEDESASETPKTE